MSALLPESAFILLHSRVNTTLCKNADHHLSIHGLSFTEFVIMHHLSAAPQNTMRRIELAECVGISASGVTRLLAPMEKNGIVEKEANPRDARVSLVKLSETGKTLFRDASVSFDACAKALVGNVTGAQLAKLTELTRKLL